MGHLHVLRFNTLRDQRFTEINRRSQIRPQLVNPAQIPNLYEKPESPGFQHFTRFRPARALPLQRYMARHRLFRGRFEITPGAETMES